MATFSGLGIGLSFLFGCIILSLVGELYYLLWWKKRFNKREEEIGGHYTSTNQNPGISYFSCWKRPNPAAKTKEQQPSVVGISSEANGNGHEQDPELGMGKDLLPKGNGEESVEAELMRLHNLCGPPRFLFTISEETKEDLESERSRSRRGSRTRSLSDLVVTLDTPFLSPLPSPPLKPHNHQSSLDCYHHQGFNPLFESSTTEAAINKLTSSPPPTFKFLRDAEEKLLRRLMAEAEKRVIIRKEGNLQNSKMVTEEKDGSFIRLIVGKNKEGEVHQQLPHHHSTPPSKVLPLASSPTAD